jgi:predicted metal-dependent phosphotriesterase family hydrolase
LSFRPSPNLDNLSLTDEATAIEEAGRFRRDGGQTLVGRQVLLSHDVCFKIRLTRYGRTGVVHIPRRTVPRLRQRGASDADSRALIVENPARALTFA